MVLAPRPRPPAGLRLGTAVAGTLVRLSGVEWEPPQISHHSRVADDVAVAAFLVGMFVGVPFALGLTTPRRWAIALWVGLGAMITLSQSQDSELGGLWVVFAVFVLVGVALVDIGHHVRERRAARRNPPP